MILMTRLQVEYIAIVALNFAYCLVMARVRYRRYFAYCDGSRRNVFAKERVSANEWKHYDRYVNYPVLTMTKDTIYFLVD